jgi:nucleotide-binding universal stress UspA family protein
VCYQSISFSVYLVNPQTCTLNNLLVAVDLKSSDQELIRYARTLAEKFNSTLWLIHIAAPDPDFVGYDVGPTYIRDMRAEELRKEHRLLQVLANQLEEKSIRAEALLIQGPTVDMLEKEVKKLNIDLLILGSHKHGFLYEMWVGHTAFKVIKEISIPVLIIPLPDGE